MGIKGIFFQSLFYYLRISCINIVCFIKSLHISYLKLLPISVPFLPLGFKLHFCEPAEFTYYSIHVYWCRTRWYINSWSMDSFAEAISLEIIDSLSYSNHQLPIPSQLQLWCPMPIPCPCCIFYTLCRSYEHCQANVRSYVKWYCYGH